MTPHQLSILNALVTYTAENVPGGLSSEERIVARIVGRWAIKGEQDDGTDWLYEEDGMGTAPEYDPRLAVRVLAVLFAVCAGIALGVTLAGGW